jgi:hypothetical protein
MSRLIKLKPCPFCGGETRLTGKDCEFIGENCAGDKMIKYKIRAICNKCHSMGKPITTDAFVTRGHNFARYVEGFWRGEVIV